MNRILIYPFLLLPFLGCYKDADSLGKNILADESVEALKIQTHDIEKVAGTWDVKVYYTNIYDSLSQAQKDNVIGVQLFRNGIERGVQTPAYSVGIIHDAISKKTCYQIAFKSKTGDFSKKSNLYCITP